MCGSRAQSAWPYCESLRRSMSAFHLLADAHIGSARRHGAQRMPPVGRCKMSAARIDGKRNSAFALPHGLSLRTFARRFVCAPSGFKLVLRVSRIRILARPTVRKRKAKCPGRTYRCKYHEGDTNTGAVIRLPFEVSLVHLRPHVHVRQASRWDKSVYALRFPCRWGSKTH